MFNLARQLGISDDISLETKLEKIEKSISAIQRIIDNGIMQKKFKPVDSSKTAKMFFFTMVGF
ncbi:MAG: hypothetical protein H7A34_06515 [bacterium]|nr:hypothetical protein [bacterium]